VVGGSPSSVWKLGVELQRVNNGVKYWQCLVRKKMDQSTIYAAAAISGSFKHLKNDHGIVEENNRFIRLGKQKRIAYEDSASVRSFSRLNSIDDLITKLLMDEFRFLFLQWIICCYLALTMVEYPTDQIHVSLIESTQLSLIACFTDRTRAGPTDRIHASSRIHPSNPPIESIKLQSFKTCRVSGLRT
jgi:hypothetical protein